MRPTNRAESALSRKRSERMASATTTALVDLPDAALLLILESVAPKQLARVCLVCHDLARLAREEALWAAHCQAAGLSRSCSVAEERAKARYARHAVQLCCECSRPTPYEFKLLSRRLCEACEMRHPQKYLLATARQLMNTQSAFQQLSSGQQKALLPQLQSMEIKGYRWYLRANAIERAAEIAGARGAPEARTAAGDAGERADAGTEGSEGSDAEGAEADAALAAEAGEDVAQEWE